MSTSDELTNNVLSREPLASDEQDVREGIALCLSGGGYRAMLFHVGVLWRLHDAGLLPKIKRVSSVSGGSITAAQLGVQWKRLKLDPADPSDFITHVVTPIRTLGSKSIDVKSVLKGIFWRGSAADHITKAYRKHLYGEATLQDFPRDDEGPRFVVNSTNVQSGVLWRFSKPYMWDYRVGKIANPTTSIATAVAASSAFPPVLSPLNLKFDPSDFVPNTGQDLQRPPYTKKVVLSDGGVYDNMGLETAIKQYKTLFVSNAGGILGSKEKPKGDWVRHVVRVLNMINSQVRSLRVRQLIDLYNSNERNGAYWSIRADIDDYRVSPRLPCPLDQTTKLAEVSTRLAKLDAATQEGLINWGYGITDAAIRTYYDNQIPMGSFPYPDREV